MSDIFLAVPDAAFCEAVAEQLKTAGYDVAQVDATADLNKMDMRAIILDEDAYDKKFLKGRRELPNDKKICVFLLGDAPADDEWITESFPKPLRLGHLLARLQFHLQAASRTRAVPLVF